MGNANSLLSEANSGVSIVALDRFIQSTRDAGYKSTASAIAELVDNSIEANARSIRITIEEAASEDGLIVQVEDDGVGMNAETLAQALRFGGSSRFNVRRGLGRFGMGLPNASLSQARRVTVHTWQKDAVPLVSYLDVDEIASGDLAFVPEPRPADVSDWATLSSETGTRVAWTKCDRLDNRRISTIERKLRSAIGRMFRYFLWQGVSITVNGSPVVALDPLFVARTDIPEPASVFDEPIEIEVYADSSLSPERTGIVQITFSELPVAALRSLSNRDKRALGIANGAGASIVRAGREVDFGWFFMGAKRKENYDDWWRCEIRFDPVLDDAFGITHTKQQIRPQAFLVDAISPTLEEIAKALNSRARQAHTSVKRDEKLSSASNVATAKDALLKQVPARTASTEDQRTLARLERSHPATFGAGSENSATRYALFVDESSSSTFLTPVCDRKTIAAIVNPRHRFYSRLFEPLCEGAEEFSQTSVADAFKLLLLAAARAEACFEDDEQRRTIQAFRREWSEALEVLLQ